MRISHCLLKYWQLHLKWSQTLTFDHPVADYLNWTCWIFSLMQSIHTAFIFQNSLNLRHYTTHSSYKFFIRSLVRRYASSYTISEEKWLYFRFVRIRTWTGSPEWEPCRWPMRTGTGSRATIGTSRLSSTPPTSWSRTCPNSSLSSKNRSDFSQMLQNCNPCPFLYWFLHMIYCQKFKCIQQCENILYTLVKNM